MSHRRRSGAVAVAVLALLLPSGLAAGSGLETADGTAGADPAGPAAPVEPTAALAAQQLVRPVVAPAAAGPVTALGDGVAPEQAAVQEALRQELASTWLGPQSHVAVTVRDVSDGRHLLDVNAEQPLVPASLTKLLTAAAVVTALPMDQGFVTQAVLAPGTDVVVLVAGGDMLLADGAGDPESVVGRAGTSDLAAQTAVALRSQGLGDKDTPVTLQLDLSHAAGPDPGSLPDAPSGWTSFWLANGYAGPITMLGLDEDRARVQAPAPRDPAQSAAKGFRRALQRQGITVAGLPVRPVPVVAAPADGEVVGSVTSAPAREVLALAMSESDNAMLEQLARQAAVTDGAAPDPAAVADWVVAQVQESYGVDTGGVVLSDVAGLADGTLIPAATLGDLLVAGGDASHPALQVELADLPIAGYTGTLWDRFQLDVHEPAVGIARAKTGTLPTVSALAGYVVTADGRLLAFVIQADRTGRDGALLEARAVQDQMVAELARCGC